MDTTSTITRPPLPPFTLESARAKVQAAEDAWNTRDPERIAIAYTIDTVWRNRSEFIEGRHEVKKFLEGKWEKERHYKLQKTLWAHDKNRIAVKFYYEWQDESDQWHRSYGNELWEFDANGLMKTREASINDSIINASERTLNN